MSKSSLFLNWTYRLLPPRHVERILLNLMLPIGDTLFVTPTISAIRQRYPRAHITALVFPTNAGVLHANPDIDEIVLHPTGQTFTWRGYARFFRDMRRRNFSLAIEFRPYSWWISVASGVWPRLTLDMPIYRWFIPGGARPWKYRHAVESYATVIAPLGVEVTAPLLTVRTTDLDREAIAALLRDHSLAAEARLVALHPGGEGFRGMKRWEPYRFAALADRLSERYQAQIVIIGGRDELALAREVAQRMTHPALVLNGRVSLRQTVALLERCFLFVGNDSAPMHMAGSLGIPTVGLFGPTSLVNYRPLGPYVEVAHEPLVCAPCFPFVGSQTVWQGSRCRVPTCMHSLGVEQVLSSVQLAVDRKDILRHTAL